MDISNVWARSAFASRLAVPATTVPQHTAPRAGPRRYHRPERTTMARVTWKSLGDGNITANDDGVHSKSPTRTARRMSLEDRTCPRNSRARRTGARQAGLYPNPTVGYYGDEIRGGYSGGGKQGGFISQTIVTGGKLRAARRVAALFACRRRETNRRSAAAAHPQQCPALFYQVLADQRLVEVRQNLAKLAADATQTSHQLANVGQADRPDVLQAEVEQQQINIGLRIAQQNLRSSWRTLAAVAGKPDLPQNRLEGDLEAIPDLNYEEWLATTLRDSPEVKLAQQALDRAEASLAQAKKVSIPDLQLYGNLSQNYEPLETTRKPVGLERRRPDRRPVTDLQSQPGQHRRGQGRDRERNTGTRPAEASDRPRRRQPLPRLRFRPRHCPAV